jgi:acetyl esterase/lipase
MCTFVTDINHVTSGRILTSAARAVLLESVELCRCGMSVAAHIRLMNDIVRVRIVLWSFIVGGCAIGCVVPDPGPGDTLPATPPALAPPIVFNYRNPGNPISDPGQFPDAELVDVYVPAPTGSRPGMLLWVHGGGWVGGTRADVPAWVLQQVPRGYVVASIGYRLVSYDADGVVDNAFPAAVEDIKVAIPFLRNLGAFLGASPHLILAGASAGGHLAAFVGATPGQFEADPAFRSEVSAVVDIVGPTDLRALATPVDPPNIAAQLVAYYVASLLGCPQPTIAAPYTCPPGTDFEGASVIPQLDVTDPPMYFGYGGTDVLISAGQGAAAAAGLYQVTGEKLMSWYDLAETAGHDLDGTALNMTALQGFLDAARDGRFDEVRKTLPH